MKELEQVNCCFVDHGLYLPLARKLAQTYNRVLYWTPWEKAYPRINDTCIGDGFDDIERIDDFWGVKDEINLFVFPDILHAGLQRELRDQGFPVWGSASGDELELKRMKFLNELGKTDLPMPVMVYVCGVSELRRELRDKKDKYIKLSKHRGTMETWHWRSWPEDRGRLDHLAVKLGPLADLVHFLVCDAIETDIEVGGDTYCIDGKFPSHMMEGYEWKDKSCLSAFKRSSEIAEPVRRVMEAFGPVLERYAYRNYFSAEVRVQDDQGYFIDPCCRGPLPMTFSQMEVYGNLAEIIYAGAQGELVDPRPMAQYACEVALTCKGQPHTWTRVEVPTDLEDAMKIMCCCQAEGACCLPPDDHDDLESMVGWLVATGDTPRAALEKQLAQVELLPDGVEAAVKSMTGLLSEIRAAEAQGLEFSPHAIPRPAEAIPES